MKPILPWSEIGVKIVGERKKKCTFIVVSKLEFICIKLMFKKTVQADKVFSISLAPDQQNRMPGLAKLGHIIFIYEL